MSSARIGALRSLAAQDVAEMGGPLSVLSRQKRDHVELDGLLHQLTATPPAEQGGVLLRLYRLVFPHAFAEEAVLWPVIRRVLPNGHDLTLQVEREHQAINELVTRLEVLDPDAPERAPVVERLIALLREDVRDEEDVLLPRLQAELSTFQLRLLGIAWEGVRRIAPTRAHPIVARRPPGNVLATLPLTIVDHLRDLVGMIRKRPRAAAGPALRPLASGLRRTSHALEHLPGMRSGEDPSTRIGRRARLPWQGVLLAGIAVSGAALVLARRKAPRA